MLFYLGERLVIIRYVEYAKKNERLVKSIHKTEKHFVLKPLRAPIVDVFRWFHYYPGTNLSADTGFP